MQDTLHIDWTNGIPANGEAELLKALTARHAEHQEAQQPEELEFTVNGQLYLVSETSSGWVWEAYADRKFTRVLDDAGYFATVAEAQQAAMAHAMLPEAEPSEVEVDAYHRALHRIFRNDSKGE